MHNNRKNIVCTFFSVCKCKSVKMAVTCGWDYVLSIKSFLIKFILLNRRIKNVHNVDEYRGSV